jgi:dihydropteroate synthase type 2
VIKLGPAASHPDAARVTADDQRRRLAPVIEQLTADSVPVSVDSFVPDIQRFAVARGAAYLNDIRGFPDPSLYDELAAASCRLVVMHSVQRDGPATKVATDPAAVWAGIDSFFADRLAASGPNG